jgi:hypothetical protein
MGVKDLSRFCAVVRSEATIIGLALLAFPDFPPLLLPPPPLELLSSLSPPPSSLDEDSDEELSVDVDSAFVSDELLLCDELDDVDADGVDDAAALDAAAVAELATLAVAEDAAELTTLPTTLDVTWFCVT